MEALPAKWQTLLKKLQDSKTLPSALVGFDGFIDSLVRVIESSEEGKPVRYFETMKDFTAYTSQKSGSNFSMELEENICKMGGNAPITSFALSRLGIPVTSIGAFGYPKLSFHFDELASHCKLMSFTDPGTSTALEFNDGKIIMGEMRKLNETTWKDVITKLDVDVIRQEADQASLICFLNWSEIRQATDIWNGMLMDVLPYINQTPRRTAFFDLADFSRKSSSSVKKILHVIQQFKETMNVVLGVNLNEARELYTLLSAHAEPSRGIEETGQFLFDKINPTALIIHYSIHAFAWDGYKMYHRKSVPILSPLISTGAGDNFNAGVCFGLLNKMDLPSCLELGHATAFNYMTTGQSPGINELMKTLLTSSNE